MKRAKKLLGGIAALALAMFLAPGIAQAADYNGSCSAVPSGTISGNATLSASGGTCTLPHDVSATSYIHIGNASSIVGGKNLTAGAEIDVQTSGTVTLGNLSADYWYIYVTGGGDVAVGTVTTNTYGNIFLVAAGDLKTSNITGAPGYNVDLKAHTGGGNAMFTIGGTSNNNGVNGTITGTPGSNGPTWASTVVYVTNGDEDDTGGITLTAPDKISVAATNSYRAGYIFLNAQDGELLMPSGTLSLDGYMTSTGAGNIGLMANTVVFDADATISAVQDPAVTGTLHGIAIAANQVEYSGSSGLTLQAGGEGYAQYYNGFVQVAPQGALVMTDSQNPAYLSIYGYVYPYSVGGGVSFVGADDAPLSITANGSAYTQVEISGYPIVFSGGDVTLEAKAGAYHAVRLYNQGTWTGSAGLSFDVSGDVLISALGEDGDGGDVFVQVDQVSIDASSFRIVANGPESGDGNGGSVYFYTTDTSLDPSTPASISANGASDGSGDAIYGDPTTYDPVAITFTPGSAVELGTGDGEFALSATSGSDGGNAGTIKVNAWSGITINSAFAVDASALLGNGDGGWIYLGGYITSFADNALSLVATGHGTGLGGKIEALHYVSNLNVNKLMKVDGGESVGTSDSDGTITLNYVACGQWRTGYVDGSSNPVWPFSYWDCVNPTSPTDTVATAAHALPASLTSLLGSNEVQIYYMNLVGEYSTYFGDSAYGNHVYGISASLLSPAPLMVSAAFANVTTGSGTVDSETDSDTATIVTGTITHELAHQLDGIWGEYSATSTWTTNVDNDTSTMSAGYINYESCATVWPGPISDYRGISNPCSYFSPQTNTQIFGNLYQSTYRELFAMIFEHQIANAAHAPLENACGYFPDSNSDMSTIISNGHP